MIRRPPRSTLSSSSAASDVYKRQALCRVIPTKWRWYCDHRLCDVTLPYVFTKEKWLFFFFLTDGPWSLVVCSTTRRTTVATSSRCSTSNRASTGTASSPSRPAYLRPSDTCRRRPATTTTDDAPDQGAGETRGYIPSRSRISAPMLSIEIRDAWPVESLTYGYLPRRSLITAHVLSMARLINCAVRREECRLQGPSSPFLRP